MAPTRRDDVGGVGLSHCSGTHWEHGIGHPRDHETYARSMARRSVKKAFRDPETLSSEEIAALRRRYWHSDEPRGSIEDSFGVSSIDFGRLAAARPTGEHCRYCEGPMVWTSRQARDSGNARCSSCKHRIGERCACVRCRYAAEEQQRREQIETARQQAAAVADWRQTYGSESYLREALRKLSPSVRAFLVAAVESVDSAATWWDVADRAGVPRRYVSPHLNRLHTMRLVFFDGKHHHIHPGLYVRRVLVG